MLKFFRQYNKYILAVGVAMLMVAFLIEPTLSMFDRDISSQAIGTIGSEAITLGEQRHAHAELQVLAEISPVLVELAGNRPGRATSPLQWLLMLREARAMGLSTGVVETDQMIQFLGLTESQVSGLARRMGVAAATVDRALRHWVMIQTYKELIQGVVHAPAYQRLQHYAAAGQFLQHGIYQGVLLEIESAFQGRSRLSRPLLERVLFDHQARVKVTAVGVPSERYLPQATEPTEQEIKDLFDQHKDKLPGEGQPYGFGYRSPNRVKIEYLAVPFDRLQQAVTVEEADALGYYDTHPDEFRAEPPPPETPDQAAPPERPVQPYAEVRGDIIAQLKQQRAAELGDRIIKAAQATLLEDARGLTEKDGSKVVPAGWKPLSLDELANRLQTQFAVLPDVQRHDDWWLTSERLAMLEGIGSSGIAGQPSIGFVEYVQSAKPFQTANLKAFLASNRPEPLLPSLPLVSADGGRYLFRLLDAQPARVPGSVDEARAEVVHDAKRLAAYRLLKAESHVWLDKARSAGLESLAAELGGQPVKPEPFSRRQTSFDGLVSVPNIPGIGRSTEFVDAVFTLVDQTVAMVPARDGTVDYTAAIQQLTPAVRTTTAVSDNQMKLWLVRLEGFEPVTRGEFEKTAGSPLAGAWVDQALVNQAPADVFSIESLSKRLGYKPESGGDGEDPSQNVPQDGPLDSPEP